MEMCVWRGAVRGKIKDCRIQAAPALYVVAHVIADSDDPARVSQQGANMIFNRAGRFRRQMSDGTLHHENDARGIILLGDGQEQDPVLADDRPIRLERSETFAHGTPLLLRAVGRKYPDPVQFQFGYARCIAELKAFNCHVVAILSGYDGARVPPLRKSLNQFTANLGRAAQTKVAHA